MSVLSRIKQYLPGSSRSLHAAHEDIWELRSHVDELDRKLSERLDALYGRIEIADRGINSNINYKFDCKTLPLLDRLSVDLDAHDSHMKMFAWENYRRSDESIADAKRRFFSTLPPASGGLRLLQLGCAKLLGEFDSFCREHEIPYWIHFGTLIGAVRHKGFIPWDDDTDLGIMRDDLDSLIKAVEHDDRFRITVVYDRFVHCRQVRFLYADESVPCFLDLFIFDWAPRPDDALAERQRDLRRTMVSKMEADSTLDFWKDQPYYFGDKSQLIQQYFDDCIEIARDEGIICDRDNADAIVWSIDNLDDGKQSHWIYSIDSVFPLQRLTFEGVELDAPANPFVFLQSRYGDIYELPRDINTHFEHVDHDDLEFGQSKEAISNIL